MSELTILRITRLSSARFHFSLSGPSSQFEGPVERIWEVNVNPAALAIYSEAIASAIRAANQDPYLPGATYEALIGPGTGLYNELFHDSPDLAHSLRTTATPLLITTDAPELYWELLFDSDRQEFFAFGHEASRRLLSRAVPVAIPRRNSQPRCLIVANPNAGDAELERPELEEQAIAMRDWFQEHGVLCEDGDFLIGANASIERVLLKFIPPNDYDIVVFSGHTVPTDNGFALLLAGRALLEGAVIRKLRLQGPIVVLSSCWAGTAKGLANAPGTVEGMTDAFIEAGAQMVLGSLFEVPAAGARVFTQTFLECMVQGGRAGVALRNARVAVRGNSDYGCSWACFVLYGDPGLRIDLQLDLLASSLKTHAWSKDDFEPEAIALLQRAFALASSLGPVGPSHLAAAISESEDGPLWQHMLKRRAEDEGVDLNHLQDAVNAANATSGQSLGPNRGRFTPSALSAITAAHRMPIARNDGGRVSVRDIMEALLTIGMGLEGENMSIDHSGPSRPAGAPEPAHPSVSVGQLHVIPPQRTQRIGPLQEEECAPKVWHALRVAASIAISSGSPNIGTSAILTAFASDTTSAFSQSLRRFGNLGSRVRNLFVDSAARSLQADVQFLSVPECSPNVMQIIIHAQLSALSRGEILVSDSDILESFVLHGQSAMATALEETGITVAALVNQAFSSDGSLNYGVIDDALRASFALAADCANSKHHSRVGRRHLMYAMLSSERSLLASIIQDQRLDSVQIASALFVAMKPSPTPGPSVDLRLVDFSVDLVRIICRAGSETNQSDAIVTERRLLRSLVEDGAGDVGMFMVALGVDWNSLVAALG